VCIVDSRWVYLVAIPPCQRGDAVPIIKARSSTLFADSTHCTAEADIIHDKALDEILAEDKQLYNLIVVS
jgi:hypothetical protein